MPRRYLWVLLPIYGLSAHGLDGLVALLLSIPDACADLLGDDQPWLRRWMTGTFVAHLLLGLVSRHVLLLWLAPASSLLSPRSRRGGFGLGDGLFVAGLIVLTLLVPNAVIYFSAAPLIPIAAAFGLTWSLRRHLGDRLEWKHLLFGFEVALIMWLGAIHAGSLALRCAG